MEPPLALAVNDLGLGTSACAVQPASIVIVDDDDRSQLLIREALRDVGLLNPVVALLDGPAAIGHLRQAVDVGPSHIPALVFLDWQMPGCDGIEVLRWMRASPALVRVPVVMLSSDDRADHVKEAYDLGASSYLVKPLAFSALGAVVRGLPLRWQIV